MEQFCHSQKSLHYTVRPGQRGDIAGIQEVARASWHGAHHEIFSKDAMDLFLASVYSRVSLRASLANRCATFLVAVFDGRVLGFCEFGDRGAGPELFRLYIHPRVWGRGVGRRLLSHAEMQLATCGGRHYFVTVHNGNERRKSFLSSRASSIMYLGIATTNVTWASFWRPPRPDSKLLSVYCVAQ